MKRALLLAALLLASCGKPEDDSDLKSAFAASALKDPSSVQLRNVKANAEVICGEYNSKNSYGAYDGFEPFVFKRNIEDLWLGDHDNQDSRSAFRKECPNASELGLNANELGQNGDATTLTTDMNATDMNASVDADAALNGADDAVSDASDAIAKAQADLARNQARDEATGLAPPDGEEDGYNVNNDAGE